MALSSKSFGNLQKLRQGQAQGPKVQARGEMFHSWGRQDGSWWVIGDLFTGCADLALSVESLEI